MSAKRVLLVVLAGFLLLALTVSPGASQPPAQEFAAVDAYIHEMMRLAPIPGLALAIVRGDQIVYQQGYGTADRVGTPVTPQTPFMIASVTKTFTALAVQQLVEAGKIDLDAPVQTYLSEFQLADPSAARKVTVRHLLDHTSAISTLEGSQSYLYSPRTTFTEALDHLASFRPRRSPGEKYDYSNWNYILLGEIIARVSGQPYSTVIQTRILDPLEMSQSNLADPAKIPGSAQGNIISFGLSVPYAEPYIPVSLSAGYMSASAQDLAHTLIAYFNRGRYQDSVLLSPQGEGWYDVYWNWKPGRPDDIAIDHSGGHESFNTDIQLFLQPQIGVVILMNTRLDTLFPGPSAAEIAFNVGRIVQSAQPKAPSMQGFLLGYILMDLTLLALAAAVIWQVIRFNPFRRAVTTASGRRRLWLWVGAGLDLLLAAAIGLLPGPFNSQWSVVLAHRADFAVSLLSIALGLGLLGLIKSWLLLSHRSVDQVLEIHP
jgi:CubicO group peptidase (beta-lactamase class C family)